MVWSVDNNLLVLVKRIAVVMKRVQKFPRLVTKDPLELQSHLLFFPGQSSIDKLLIHFFQKRRFLLKQIGLQNVDWIFDLKTRLLSLDISRQFELKSLWNHEVSLLISPHNLTQIEVSLLRPVPVNNLKKTTNLFRLLTQGKEVRNVDPLFPWYHLTNILQNLIHQNLLLNLKNPVNRLNTTGDHKLNFSSNQRVVLIQIEHLEDKPGLILKLSFGKNNQSRKELQSVDHSIATVIEGFKEFLFTLLRAEDLFVFIVVNREVLTDGLENPIKLSDLRKWQRKQSVVQICRSGSIFYNSKILSHYNLFWMETC